MKRIRDILLALVCTIIIVGATNDGRTSALEQPDSLTEQISNEFEGIPEEIQGVWNYESKTEMVDQSVVLRGNQMIIRDEYNGSVYYTVNLTQVEKNFEFEGVEDNDERTLYILNTDVTDYQMRYGDLEQTLVTDAFYFIYDKATDTLIPQMDVEFTRDAEEELSYVVQDNLIAQQPINREQLREVDNAFIVEQHLKHEEEGSEDVYLELYRDIANDYPDLNLLRNEDYEAYLDASEIIVMYSELTFTRLNQADPAKVLALFQEVSIDGEGDYEAMVQEIYPQIESDIQTFHKRLLTYENSLKYQAE